MNKIYISPTPSVGQMESIQRQDLCNDHVIEVLTLYICHLSISWDFDKLSNIHFLNGSTSNSR